MQGVQLNMKCAFGRGMKVVGVVLLMLTMPGLPLQLGRATAMAAATEWSDDFDAPSVDPRWYWVNEDPSM